MYVVPPDGRALDPVKAGDSVDIRYVRDLRVYTKSDVIEAADDIPLYGLVGVTGDGKGGDLATHFPERPLKLCKFLAQKIMHDCDDNNPAVALGRLEILGKILSGVAEEQHQEFLAYVATA